jgi:hypothetical protein
MDVVGKQSRLGKYMNATQDKTHYVLCLEMFSKQLDFGKIGKGKFCLTQHSFIITK